ncbi:MAG: hypothetical protein DRP42_06925 [Tenericutes bacterium]|nr:MAG: hypothetical protein DRP42_06925 [Mycoplasmatota bacterium]
MSNQLKEKCNYIAEASQGTPLSDADDTQIAAMLHNIVIYTGATQDQVLRKDNKAKFYWLLRKALHAFTIEEIDFAFELAIGGELNIELNLFGRPISILYISNAVKAYSEYAETLKKQYSIQVSREREQSQVKPPNKTSQFIGFKQGIVDNYELFVNGEPVRNFGGVYSRFIKSLSIEGFNADIDHPDQIEKAKQLYAKGAEYKILRSDPDAGATAKAVQIVENIYSGKDVDSSLYAGELDSIYLTDFFLWVQSTQKDIEELIQSHFKNFKI